MPPALSWHLPRRVCHHVCAMMSQLSTNVNKACPRQTYTWARTFKLTYFTTIKYEEYHTIIVYIQNVIWSMHFRSTKLNMTIMEVLSSIPAESTIIYRFLCGLYAFSCARASKFQQQIFISSEPVCSSKHTRVLKLTPVHSRWVVFWHNFCGMKWTWWVTGSWWCCLSLEVLSSILPGSTIIYRFLYSLYAFPCVRASKLNLHIFSTIFRGLCTYCAKLLNNDIMANGLSWWQRKESPILYTATWQ